MLSRVESIGVEETFWGRMLGYGSVTVRGTGGTPESFVMISHPQEFRRSVQAQIGHVEPTVDRSAAANATSSALHAASVRRQSGNGAAVQTLGSLATERQVFN